MRLLVPGNRRRQQQARAKVNPLVGPILHRCTYSGIPLTLATTREQRGELMDFAVDGEDNIDLCFLLQNRIE